MGRLEEGVAALRRAVQLAPRDVSARNNLARALLAQRSLDEALIVIHTALQLDPTHSETHANESNILREQGRLDEAVAAARRALELNPTYAYAHNLLGIALGRLGRNDEAMASYHAALRLQPHYPEALVNLGAVHSDEGRFEQAATMFCEALRLRPDYPEACANLSLALRDLGKFDEAMGASRRALELSPESTVAQANHSLLLLLRGDFEEAWPLYEARWHPLRHPKSDFPEPQWRGEPLDGRRVLIHEEQGFGDMLHFIRYAPLVAARGGQVIVRCHRFLKELLRHGKGVSAVVSHEDRLPEFDLHVPILSLPSIFRTDGTTIPCEVPYLFADAGRREAWRRRLGDSGARLRVGLAWAGNVKNRRNQTRSVGLSRLLPLMQVEGVDFISLQIDRAREQLREFAEAALIADFAEHIHDFADTAGLVAELDLIVTVDTAVAHLAGGLALPVWTLLPFVPDWRWGLEGETTPWYPTMRLFRQPVLGDWEAVISKVTRALTGAAKRGVELETRVENPHKPR